MTNDEMRDFCKESAKRLKRYKKSFKGIIQRLDLAKESALIVMTVRKVGTSTEHSEKANKLEEQTNKNLDQRKAELEELMSEVSAYIEEVKAKMK